MAFRYSPRIVNDGLVFCLDAKNKNSYPGSGLTTSNILDKSQKGTLENGVTITDNAFDFGGDDDYINFGDINNANGDTPFSYGCWFNADTFVGFDMLMGKYEWNSSHGWYIFTNGNKLMYLLGPVGAFIRKTTIQTFETGRWYHAFVTYDGSRDISGFKMYINGIEDLSMINNSVFGAGPVENNFDFVIGCSSEGANGFFNGKIANVSIYNRELTPQEILQNYNTLKGRYGL